MKYKRTNPRSGASPAKSNTFVRQFKIGSQVYEFIPKKQLGQNFLIDGNIQDKMLQAGNFQADDTVLEIGPGLGTLTHRIAERVKKMYAVETDPRLFESLKKANQNSRLEIIQADFLKYDLSGLPKKMKGIGNLPYYITSPIIDKIFKNREHFSSFFITVQLELGKRLTAKAGSKEYSAFTLFVQYFSDVKLLFKIKNTSFKPAPKVHSCFLELKIRDLVPKEAVNEELLFSLIRTAFQQRRKTLSRGLSGIVKKEKLLEALKTLSLDEKVRAEDLSLNKFVQLTNLIDLQQQTAQE